jgi:hypothetical protein
MRPSQVTGADAGTVDPAKAFMDRPVGLDRVFDNHQELVGYLSSLETRFVFE